jgi:S-formylglutathione hydrolase FrmB
MLAPRAMRAPEGNAPTARESERTMIRLAALSLALAAIVAPVGSARAAAPSCGTPLSGLTIGSIATASCASDDLGGATTFSYYIPSLCNATTRCPVLYLLHGFGGDYRSMLGSAEHPSAYARALTKDPITGADLPDIPFIVIAPDGRTVQTIKPGAPPADQESFWVDWNPRYWTNPPRFEAFVTDELLHLVDRSFPTIATREGRAILGQSLGGFGSFKLAFQHPDLYATAGSISGALNILVAPDLQPIGAGPDGVGGAPVPTTYVHPPRIITTPPGFPYGDPFGAFGDPTTDEAYFRGNNPLDLAMNGAGVALRFFHNDAVPGPDDLADPASYFSPQLLETLVLPMNFEMREALTQHGIPFEYELHPGIHKGVYWDPYIRAQLEWQYARVSHPGAALKPYKPASFDYRSIKNDFSVWGWRFHVDRTPEEFLTLRDISSAGMTVTGSGVVTFVTPRLHAGSAVIDGATGSVTPQPGGRMRITIDLGPSYPTDERAGASGVPAVLRTAHICFVYSAGHCS